MANLRPTLSDFVDSKGMNERITEDIVRTHFKTDGLIGSIKLEEQKTKHKIIKELLQKASKRGTGKAGFPEFIITFPELMDSVILVECKPETKLHRSKQGGNDPEKYAVDGVLYYSSFLKDDFNVIAIAVSGEKQDSLSISNFFIRKRSSEVKELDDKKLLSLYNYLNVFEQKETAEKLKDQNLLMVAADLNQELFEQFIPENERATIVSGVLIALQNKGFKKSYSEAKKPSELVEDLLVAIERVLKARKMGDKTPILMGEYRKITQSNNLAIAETIRNKETGKDEPNTILRDLIFEIDKKVFPFTEYDHMGYDILGQFYSEFIRYVYGDKKLGLVLTPQHVAELFVDIADLNVDDILYDNCCGTAGFLIKGMKKLMELAGNDEGKKETIQRAQLIGLEIRSDMFTYACSNMMMRGDGKSNIFHGDSLSLTNRAEVKKHKPTVGFLNPPYSTGTPELEFVYYNLDCIEKGHICVAIVPLNAVTAQEGSDYDWKKKLLQEHTLEAVFSMPESLFYPAAGTVTAIIVFKAHIPHPKDHETYFGYWRNDGFITVKHLGRVDFHGKWKTIKQEWIYNYRNRKEIKGQSLKRIVSADDEWCTEAYLETDYSSLKKEDFESEIKKYVLFKELGLIEAN